MYKKITGVDAETCRDNIQAARHSFGDIMASLNAVKGLDQTRKQDNDLERAEIRRQEKQAESFKFGKMSKTKPFFPTLNTRGFFQQEGVESIDHGLPYLPGRDKESLLFPNKVKDYSKRFNLQKTCDGAYFTEQVG